MCDMNINLTSPPPDHSQICPTCDGELVHERRRSKCTTCDHAHDASDSQRRSGRDRDFLSALAILRCFLARVITGARPAAFCPRAAAAAGSVSSQLQVLRVHVCSFLTHCVRCGCVNAFFIRLLMALMMLLLVMLHRAL